MTTPVIETNCFTTTLVDTVVGVRRQYGITYVLLAETRLTADHPDRTEIIRDVTVRLAIPDERVAEFCQAILAGRVTARDLVADMAGRAH